eukprot:TRINITY_DN42018_c0_g1_i1.p1 TRINITY_DN42018_c0_g1~~TRINITY_DN42018_c0_g1_i1.p1  ORF type:complete len:374 (-),score=115.56 TRINITY_DN42018_c0_g1_i1:252-1373(-)
MASVRRNSALSGRRQSSGGGKREKKVVTLGDGVLDDDDDVLAPLQRSRSPGSARTPSKLQSIARSQTLGELKDDAERLQEAADMRKAEDLGVTLAQYQEMKDIFSLFSADLSGAVDPKSIRKQMSALGFEVDNNTIYQLISDLDSDGSQKIEFDEFAGLLQDLGLYNLENTTLHSCNEIFDFLDELDPQKRDHKIEADNLVKVAKVLGDNISIEEMEAMISGADRNGKGYVSNEDYYEMMLGLARKLESTEVASGSFSSFGRGNSPSQHSETSESQSRKGTKSKSEAPNLVDCLNLRTASKEAVEKKMSSKRSSVSKGTRKKSTLSFPSGVALDSSQKEGSPRASAGESSGSRSPTTEAPASARKSNTRYISK